MQQAYRLFLKKKGCIVSGFFLILKMFKEGILNKAFITSRAMNNFYINIHSHHPPGADEWCIQSIYRDFSANHAHGPVSMGLHPWHIKEKTAEDQLAELKRASTHANVWAIGECGLDKAIVTDIKFQEKIFVQQLLWANEIDKPLIIHCVRAFDEILMLLRKNQNKVPVIFHGFNKKSDTAQRILQAGHWLSFGPALQHFRTKEVFEKIPLNSLFLETDDGNLDIRTIYQLAASILNISEEQLSLQLKQNVKTVFNTDIT